MSNIEVTKVAGKLTDNLFTSRGYDTYITISNENIRKTSLCFFSISKDDVTYSPSGGSTSDGRFEHHYSGQHFNPVESWRGWCYILYILNF
jgi:hypothetical protein